MKLVLFFSGIILNLISGASAQDTWVSQSPAAHLNAVFFPTTSTGYVVGDKGLVMKTTDAGSHWTTLISGTQVNLNGVFFTSANTGYIVGDKGGLFKTTNGGASWTAALPKTTATLYGIAFTDSLTGYAVGADSCILKTVDAGGSWDKQPSPIARTFYAVQFTGPNKGYVVGSNGLILKNSDGAKWESQADPVGAAANNLYALSFVDSAKGYAVGALGAAFKTVNGGGLWTTMTSPSGANFYGVCFTDSVTGYAVADDGQIYKTINGGTSWIHNALPIGMGTWLRAIYFINANTGFAVGTDLSILSTGNDGVAWNPQTSGTSYYSLFGLAFSDSLTGYAVGDGAALLKTVDGGVNWTLHELRIVDALHPTGEVFSGVQFTGTDTGYAVGSERSIFKTTNGGATWAYQASPVTVKNPGYLCVWFQNSGVGYVGGEYGVLLKTMDAGAHWAQTSITTTQSINDIFFRTADTGYAVGTGGVIFKTINAGANWSPLQSGTTSPLTSICFTKNGKGYIVGHGLNGGGSPNGILLQTIGGSDSAWSDTTLINVPLNSVRFYDDNTGYIAGYSGVIMKTTTAGAKWELQASGTTKTLNCVRLVVGRSAYIAGWNGTLLKSGRNFSLTPPTLIAPAAGATDIAPHPTLTWSTQTGATYYETQVASDSLFSNPCCGGAIYAASTIYNATLSLNTPYFWRVRVGNNGGVSDWSPFRSFTTSEAAPNAPELVYPTSGQTVTTMPVTLCWKKTQRATSYLVQVSTDPGFIQLVTDKSNLTDTTLIVSGLTDNTQFWWHIEAKNGAGLGPLSVRQTFTIEAGESKTLFQGIPKSITFEKSGQKIFRFGLPEAGRVTLKLYDQKGKLRVVLLDGFYGSGFHDASIDSDKIFTGSFVVDFETKGYHKQVEWKRW